MEQYKALIVDDERMIREGIRKCLNWGRIGVTDVYTAGNVREALAVISREDPDLMITDISMGDMTGITLIERARKIKPSLRIIVLTGYDRFEYARDCLRLNIQDFLLKPIDEEALESCIRKEITSIRHMRMERQREESERRTQGVTAQLEIERTVIELLRGKSRATPASVFEKERRWDAATELAVVVLQVPLELCERAWEQVLQLRYIQSICLDTIDRCGVGLSVTDAENGSIILIIDVRMCESDVQETMTDLIRLIDSELGCRLRAAAGDIVKGAAALSRSYQDALLLLEQEKDRLGCARRDVVLRSREVVTRAKLFSDVFEEMRREMAENVSDFSYVLHVFDSFCRAADAYDLSKNTVKKCCFDLVMNVYYAGVISGSVQHERGADGFLYSLCHAGADDVRKISREYLAHLLGKEREEHILIGQAKQYIEQNLAQEILVSSVAEQLHVSPNYFSRLFKRVTGGGCNEYIVNKRMEKARALLEETNIQTGSIALMVGYRDTNYFSMAFKKHFGLSPTAYRAQERGTVG